jgi:hypothetical protein
MQQISVDPDEEFVKPAAMQLVQHLNRQTSAHRAQCAQLHLSKILSAQIVIPNEQVRLFVNLLTIHCHGKFGCLQLWGDA